MKVIAFTNRSNDLPLGRCGCEEGRESERRSEKGEIERNTKEIDKNRNILKTYKYLSILIFYIDI